MAANPELIRRCQCPVLADKAPCEDDFDEEDFLCAHCRKTHKPWTVDDDWHIGPPQEGANHRETAKRVPDQA
jgi:hypothetical protein